MGFMPRLLLVHHSPTASTRALLDAAVAGATSPELAAELGPVEVQVRPALEATAAEVLAADGCLLGTPANFGYMSGALKHFFDTTFLQVGGALDASGSAGAAGTGARGEATAGEGAVTGPRRIPYGLWVHGRYDTTGAVRSVTTIAEALGWRRAAPVLEVVGEVGPDELAAANELGATLAAVLA